MAVQFGMQQVQFFEKLHQMLVQSVFHDLFDAPVVELCVQFAGKPLGLAAGKWRAKVAKWPAEGDRRRRAHKSMEPTQAPQLPSVPANTGGISGTP